MNTPGHPLLSDGKGVRGWWLSWKASDVRKPRRFAAGVELTKALSQGRLLSDSRPAAAYRGHLDF
eukprot:759259-Hanusia_phi.AAC.1